MGRAANQENSRLILSSKKDQQENVKRDAHAVFMGADVVNHLDVAKVV